MSLKRLLSWFRQRLPFQLDLREETPHRIAMGVSIGVFVSVTPTIGFQPFLAFFLSLLLNGNKVTAIGITLLSNPFTVVPIYYPSFLLGRYLLGSKTVAPAENPFIPGQNTPKGLLEDYYTAWADLFFPILVGSVLFALILCPMAYGITRRAVTYYRRSSPE